MEKEMHEDNVVLQHLVGKTVSAVEFVDQYDDGITLWFTDGSSIRVHECMQAGQIGVEAVLKVGG